MCADKDIEKYVDPKVSIKSEGVRRGWKGARFLEQYTFVMGMLKLHFKRVSDAFTSTLVLMKLMSSVFYILKQN